MTDENARAFRGRGARYHMVVGSAWTIARQWAFRLLGLFSTIVLARILAPEDFGLVAMAMLFVSFIQTVQRSGGYTNAIVRHPNPTDAHRNTAWTIGVIVGAATAALTLALAPVASAFFDEPLAATIMQLVSVQILLSGFINIGITSFYREFRFDLEFRLTMIDKVAGICTTIPMAFVLGDWRALIAGQFASNLARVMASYSMSRYRPWFDLSKTREILSFSVFSYLASLAQLVAGRLDQLLVGRIASSDILGQYTLSREISDMAASDTIAPANNALFAIFSKFQHDKIKLGHYFSLAFTGFCYLVSAIVVGLHLVSDEIVRVLLGRQWIPAIPFFEVLIFAVGLRVLKQTGINLLNSQGRPKIGMAINWLELTVLGGFIVVFFNDISPLFMAEIRIIAAVFVLGLPFFYILRVLRLPVGNALLGVWRPLAAALIMYVMLSWLGPAMEDWPLYARLFGKAGIGALVYIGSSLCLWYLSGRPDGAEKEGIDFVTATLRARLRPQR